MPSGGPALGRSLSPDRRRFGLTNQAPNGTLQDTDGQRSRRSLSQAHVHQGKIWPGARIRGVFTRVRHRSPGHCSGTTAMQSPPRRAFAAREGNDDCGKTGTGVVIGRGGEGPISRDQQAGGVRVPMTKTGLVSRLTTDDPRLQPKSLMQRKKITSAGFAVPATGGPPDAWRQCRSGGRGLPISLMSHGGAESYAAMQQVLLLSIDTEKPNDRRNAGFHERAIAGPG